PILMSTFMMQSASRTTTKLTRSTTAISSSLTHFFFSSRRRHTRSVSAFLLNRSSDLTYNWEGVNPDGYFLDKLEPIPSALPSFQKLFQVSATALSIP